MQPREEALKRAAEYITKDRQSDYGSAADNATVFAAVLQALGLSGGPSDYPVAMIAAKLVRLAQNPGHRDSWIDIAGYAALGYEFAVGVPATAVLMGDTGGGAHGAR